MRHYITRRFIGGFLLAILLPNFATALTNAELSKDPVVQTEQIKAVIEEVFADEPKSVIDTTVRIAMCESGYRTKKGKPTGLIVHILPNGEVRSGKVDPRDTGAFQINPAMHSKVWKRENPFNPREILENVEYAKALQDGRIKSGQNRFADWYPSRKCWRQGSKHKLLKGWALRRPSPHHTGQN